MQDTQLGGDDLDLDQVADDFFDGATMQRSSLDRLSLEWTHVPMTMAQRAAMCGTAAMACTAVVCWLLLSLLGDHVGHGSAHGPQDTETVAPQTAQLP